jgi:hypothetical protein
VPQRQLLICRVLFGSADVQTAAALGIRECVYDPAVFVSRHDLQRLRYSDGYSERRKPIWADSQLVESLYDAAWGTQITPGYS